MVRGVSVYRARAASREKAYLVALVAVRDDVDFIEFGGVLLVLLDEVVDGAGEIVERLVSWLEYASHDARSNGRDADALEFLLYRHFEGEGNEVIEWSLQVIDDE